MLLQMLVGARCVRFHASLAFIVCFISSVHVTHFVIAGDREEAEDLFQQMYESRSAPLNGEVWWTSKVHVHSSHPQLESCISRYHACFDSAGGRLRVDLEQDCPNSSELTYRPRLVLSNGKALFASDVDNLNLGGVERVNVSREALREKSWEFGHLVHNPLLWGVLPITTSHLRTFSVGDIQMQVHNSEDVSITSGGDDGHTIVTLTGYDHASCTVKYWFTPELPTLPVKISSEAVTPTGARLRMEVINDWANYHSASPAAASLYLPAQCNSRRWIDDELVMSDSLTVDDVLIGGIVDSAEFTWGGMGLPDAYVVQERDGMNGGTMKQWNVSSASFGPLQPTLSATESRNAEMLQHKKPAAFNSRMLLIIINVVIGIGITAFVVAKALRI